MSEPDYEARQWGVAVFLFIVASLCIALGGCAPQADLACTAAQRDNGPPLMCCDVGRPPGSSFPQWRCAWVHKVISG